MLGRAQQGSFLEKKSPGFFKAVSVIIPAFLWEIVNSMLSELTVATACFVSNVVGFMQGSLRGGSRHRWRSDPLVPAKSCRFLLLLVFFYYSDRFGGWQ